MNITMRLTWRLDASNAPIVVVALILSKSINIYMYIMKILNSQRRGALK